MMKPREPHQSDDSPVAHYSLEDQIKNKRDFFMLITILNRRADIPSIYYSIFSILIILQDLFISLWAYETNDMPLLLKFSSWVFLISMDNNKTLVTVTTIIMIVSILSITFIFWFIYYYYCKKRTMIPVCIFFVNIFVKLLFLIFIRPLGAQIGYIAVSEFSYSNLFLIIFQVISFISASFLIGSQTIFLSNSVMIPNSWGYSYDGIQQAFYYTYGGVITMIFSMRQLIPDFLPYLAKVLHILGNIFIIYRCFSLPFSRVKAVFVVMGFSTTYIVMDIISFVPQLRVLWVRIILIVVLMVLFPFMWYMIIKAKVKALVTREPANCKEAIQSIRVAVRYSYTDFDIIGTAESVAREIDDPITRVDFARACSFFHDLHPLFIAQIGIIKTAKTLPFFYQFLYHELCLLKDARDCNSNINGLVQLGADAQEISLEMRRIFLDIQINVSRPKFTRIVGLSNAISTVKQRYEDLLFLYPRNKSVHESYSRFLMECNCNFHAAAEEIYKSQLASENRLYYIDPVQKACISLYKEFAKIVVPPEIAMKAKSMEELDAKQKEKILSNLIKMPNVRLELSKVLLNFKSPSKIVTKVISGFRAVISIVFIILLNYSFIHTVYNRCIVIEMINDFSFIGSNMSAMLTMTNLKKQLPIYNITENDLRVKYPELYSNNESSLPDIDFLGNESEFIVRCITNVMKMTVYSMNQLIEHAQKFDDIRHIIKRVTSRNISYLAVSNLFDIMYIMASAHNTSVRSSTTLFNLIAENVAGFNQSWFGNNDMISTYFEYVMNGGNIAKEIDSFLLCLLNIVQTTETNSDMIFFIFLALMCIIVVIFMCIDYFFFANLIKVYKSLDQFNLSAIEEATQSISKDYVHYDKSEAMFHLRDSALLYVIEVIGMLISIVIVNLALFTFIEGKNSVNQINNIWEIAIFCASRSINALAIPTQIMTYKIIQETSTDTKEFLQSIVDTLNMFLEKTQEAHQYSANVTLTGSKYAEKYEALKNDSPCGGIQPGSGHSYYSCLPFSSMFPYFIHESAELINDLDNRIYIFDESFHNYIHMVFSHFTHMLKSASELMESFANDEKQAVNSRFITSVFVVCLLAIIACSFDYYVEYVHINIYKTVSSLILRVPPADVLDNQTLINILVEKKERAEIGSTLNTQLIIQSRSPIALLSPTLLFESINYSFASALGYDISHIAGRSLSCIICDPDVLHLIEKKSPKDVTEITTTIQKDNGSTIVCDITFVPISESRKSKIKNYAIIINDISANVNMLKKMNQLKLQNDRFAADMMPEILTKGIDGIINNCIVCHIVLVSPNEMESMERAKLGREIFLEMGKMLEKLKAYSRVGLFGSDAVIAGTPVTEADSVVMANDIIKYLLKLRNYIEGMECKMTASVDVGGPVKIAQTSGFRKMIYYDGPPFTNTQQIVFKATDGTITITESIYRFVAASNFQFNPGIFDNQYIVDLPLK